METKKQIQDAIDMLQTLQSDLSKNEGVSKERILALFEAYKKDCEEEAKANLECLKDYCNMLLEGSIDETYFFKKVAYCKETDDYDTGRERMIEGVIYSIENNFNEED